MNANESISSFQVADAASCSMLRFGVYTQGYTTYFLGLPFVGFGIICTYSGDNVTSKGGEKKSKEKNGGAHFSFQLERFRSSLGLVDARAQPFFFFSLDRKSVV